MSILPASRRLSQTFRRDVVSVQRPADARPNWLASLARSCGLLRQRPPILDLHARLLIAEQVRDDAEVALRHEATTEPANELDQLCTEVESLRSSIIRLIVAQTAVQEPGEGTRASGFTPARSLRVGRILFLLTASNDAPCGAGLSTGDFIRHCELVIVAL